MRTAYDCCVLHASCRYHRWLCRRVPLLRNAVFILFVLVVAFGSLFIFFSTSQLDEHAHDDFLLASISDDIDERGCNGIPLDERIADLQRILRAVRKEVFESGQKLTAVNQQYEALIKQLPEKQAELEQVLNEIESARGLLRELNDRRNVRVSLPTVPLLPTTTLIHSTAATSSISLDDLVDFSRCSISTPLRVFVYPVNSRSSPLADALAKTPYRVSDPASACLFFYLHANATVPFTPSNLPYWRGGTNHVIVNASPEIIGKSGSAIVVQEHFARGTFRPSVDYVLSMGRLKRAEVDDWRDLPQLLPYSRTNLLLLLLRGTHSDTLGEQAEALKRSALTSEDNVTVVDCGKEGEAYIMSRAHFVLLVPSTRLQDDLLVALRAGAIPVILSTTLPLPFQDTVDWSMAAIRLPLSRLSEVHFIVRAQGIADSLEMRRRGRLILETYLHTAEGAVDALFASLAHRLRAPPYSLSPTRAEPLFSDKSFAPQIQVPVNKVVQPYDEYLGPVEAPLDSPSFVHNYTMSALYSHSMWNTLYAPSMSMEYLVNSGDFPAMAEYYEDSSYGFRAIAPGSGKEFAVALGGNRPREQFTVVMLTYNRDVELSKALERLYRCPFLNKVIVVWNNVERSPPTAWPKLHVPVEFIRAPRNSLNNRFLPYDRIRTEAVLSLDDDIDLRQDEIVFAFRVWREERHRIVGFPARFDARYEGEQYYNSNHTCQASMILTGAAFIHKSYFYAYTHQMPAAIRQHVDKVTNCEDIAMNYLISHLTRRPPLKTTSKWTLRCATCEESLWNDASHFTERHECLRIFTQIYGYNPLKYSQYRADSILFKTKLPPEDQKCFRYV